MKSKLKIFLAIAIVAFDPKKPSFKHMGKGIMTTR